ncbi:T9SS type A sorting domain-containing protein [Flavisolibacter sp. BT320]|nr:T9SS type A sorting domain-containing protein [Flavisolibacter longurius]
MMRTSRILLHYLCLLLLSVSLQTVNAQLIFTKAGTGNPGDYTAATASALGLPTSVALDGSGNIYVSDQTNRVRKINASTGIIQTVAGTGNWGYSGDGGAATSASFASIYSIAVDGSGNLYIADQNNHRIRKVNAADGKVSTVAGNGTAGYTGDGGAATAASLRQPYGIAVDASGNLYISDYGNHCIRKVSVADGKISTVAGSGTGGFANGTGTAALFNNPSGITLAGNDVLYIADNANHRIRRLVISTRVVSTVAGNGTAGFAGDGGAATTGSLRNPCSVAVDAANNVYVADQNNNRIRKITAADGKISTFAGNGTNTYGGDGGAATAASVRVPAGVALDASGNLLIADLNNHRIRKVTVATGIITTIAGNGTIRFSGDGGAATRATLASPTDVAVDGNGHLYIADQENGRIRKVNAADGTISTIAGPGVYGITGDGGPATAAYLSSPTGIALDAAGNLYIVEQFNGRIRKVSAADGTITTIAGNGTNTYGGDGGAATSASLYYPMDVAVDASGNLYIADRNNHRIRKVNAMDGKISTIAGTGTAGYSGDDGQATAAAINEPNSISLDASGNLYFADRGNSRIRKIHAADGTISTVAGNGTAGFGNDNVMATATALFYPNAVYVDASANIYIADGYNRVRKVNAADGKIYRIAGSGFGGFSGDGGAPVAAALYSPWGMDMDGNGNLYIADANNYRVRYICPSSAAATDNSTNLLTAFPEQNTSLNFVKDCSVQLKLLPGGSKPVAGPVTSNVWIEPFVPTTSNGQPYVQRHYGITPEYNASTSTGSVTLYFTQAEFTAYNNHPNHGLNLPMDATDAANHKANLRITKKSGSSNDGSGLYESYTGAAEVIVPSSVVWDATMGTWAVSFDVTGFSGFFVSSSPYVLPLKLTGFTARLQDNNGMLGWETVAEENVLHFEVERRVDGRTFTSIKTVKAKGGTTNVYTHLDKAINGLGVPVVYYRLKMVDTDGSFTYSHVLSVQPGSLNIHVSLFPNPAQQRAVLTIEASKKDAVQYSVVDAMGRTIQSKKILVNEGINPVAIETNAYPAGVYTLLVTGSANYGETRFVKQ